MTNSSNRCACGGLRHKHDVEEIEQLRGNLSQMEVQRDHWLEIAREKDTEIEELKRWQLEAAQADEFASGRTGATEVTKPKCIACGVELETGWAFAHCGRKECGVAHKDDLIQRLRFVQSQGGGYYELAQDCIDLIEAMASVGIRQEAENERLEKDLRRANTALVRHGVQEMRPGNADEPEASHYCIDCNEAHDPRTCGALKSGGGRDGS